MRLPTSNLLFRFDDLFGPSGRGVASSARWERADGDQWRHWMDMTFIHEA